jgi:hypothetical protein
MGISWIEVRKKPSLTGKETAQEYAPRGRVSNGPLMAELRAPQAGAQGSRWFTFAPSSPDGSYQDIFRSLLIEMPSSRPRFYCEQNAGRGEESTACIAASSSHGRPSIRQFANSTILKFVNPTRLFFMRQ